MSPFFSRKGDEGQTGLLGNKRVFKDEGIIELNGNLDELSSSISLARNTNSHEEIKAILLHIQRDLFHIMSEVAAVDSGRERFNYTSPSHIEWLESQIKMIEATIKFPSHFILPGDSLSAAYIDQARTVTRRSERRAVTLNRAEGLSNGLILNYLNRLSSLFFALELFDLHKSGITPTPVREDKKL